MKILPLLLFYIIFLIGIVSAVTVQDVIISDFQPGDENKVVIEIENVLNDIVEDVSLEINVENIPFTTVGSSQFSIDEIEVDENKRFNFIIKAANNINLGDYQIPYTIKYFLDDEEVIKMGSFGVRVISDSEIEIDFEVKTPVIGEKGTIEIKIINKGFGDIKFVSVKIFPDGFNLLSEKIIYIGNIDSDDFDTAVFDVAFTKENARVRAIIEFKDFDNNKELRNINVPISVYTQERAIELGIIEANKTALYSSIGIGIIIIWLIWRSIRKRRRLKKSKIS